MLPTEVWPRLWLAGARFHSLPQHRATPVDLLVTVCTPGEAWHSPPAKRCIDLPMPDRELTRTQEELDDLTEQIVQALNDGQTVYVQCHWGLERSALVCALVVEQITGDTPRQVLEYLQRIRPVLWDETSDFARFFLEVEQA